MFFLFLQALENQDRSVESLLGLSDEQLQRIVMDMGGDAEDVRKLTVSLQQLRKFQSRFNLHLIVCYCES